MLLDEKSLLSSAQAVTVDAISTNVIDLEVAGRDVFRGKPLYCVIGVDTTVTATGAATVTFTIEADSAVGLDATPTVLYTSPAIAKASLTAGAQPVKVAVPEGLVATDRYVGVRYNVSATLTAGKFDAFLVEDIDNAAAYYA